MKSPSLDSLENYIKDEKINKCATLYSIKMKSTHILGLVKSNENRWQHLCYSSGIWPILFECVCGLENENETFFVELWHVCDTKSCVKKFGGGKINEIYSGTIYHALMLI